MAERDKERYTAGEVLEAIFEDDNTSKRQVRRKLFDKPSQDDVEGPENCMGHAGGSLVTRDNVEGPENHMGHADGSSDQS